MKKKNTISAVVLTKNEQDNIADCLRSLDWCDEIVVIDDNSKDNTISNLRASGANIYIRPLNGDFAAQRNFGLEKTRCEWILFIDADERVTYNLREEILIAIKSQNVNGFSLMRQDFLLGQELRFGETAHAQFIRLARKGSGAWKRPIHEVWDVQGKKENLVNKIFHYPHPNLAQFIDKVNYYTEIEAKFRKHQGDKPCLWQTLAFPIGKYLKNYFIFLGFLDGFPGIVMAFMMSLHSLCVRVKTMEV